MLVGMCGKAGSGKDTVARYLIENYGYQQIALADPIKRLVKDVFVLDNHAVYDRVEREKPLDKWGGWSVRKLLQFIGTELFRDNIDDEIWVKSLWYRIEDDVVLNNYVVSDVRFPNELNFFKKNVPNGYFATLKVIRDGCGGEVGLAGHASEAYNLDTDIVIHNNETIKDLYNKVEKEFIPLISHY